MVPGLNWCQLINFWCHVINIWDHVLLTTSHFHFHFKCYRFLGAFPLLTSSCCLITIPWYFCGFMQFGFLIDSKLCGLRANTRNSVLFRSREPNLEPLTKQRLYLLRPSVFKKDFIITNITSTIILTELSWQWWSWSSTSSL